MFNLLTSSSVLLVNLQSPCLPNPNPSGATKARSGKPSFHLSSALSHKGTRSFIFSANAEWLSTLSLFLPSFPPFNFRRRPEAKASATVGNPGSGRKKANLSARRQERVFIPNFCDGNGRAFPISDFFRHPTGVEALLNTRALQKFEPLDSNTFRCTLYKIQFLKFEVSPVIDLRVTPTDEDCTVEMLSCRFEGSKAIEKQNQLFSAFMRNHITWEADNSEPCLVVDVNLRIALDVYTKPFSLLPLSAVEKPGNLVMQGLLDRLVPLLAEKLHSDYCTWVEQQMNSQI